MKKILIIKQIPGRPDNYRTAFVDIKEFEKAKASGWTEPIDGQIVNGVKISLEKKKKIEKKDEEILE